jgi:tetratricopeptide (TPR) repeat protein
MSERSEPETRASKPRKNAAAEASAWTALSSASKAKVDAFLTSQARLAELQAQNLTEQNRFELSHLRWRAFNEKMKGAGQIMLVAAGLAVIALVATVLWNASRAKGLVVETFTVPPGYAATGFTGEVLADDLTNAVGAIRDRADANSLVRSDNVRQERYDDIRVEIADTGISINQVWRSLRLWLGQERRLRGSLRTLGDGTIALTVALDGDRAFTLDGTPADLPKLEQQAAERIFESVDPNNYVIWLLSMGRREDCMAAVERYATRPFSTRDHAAGVSLWGGMTRAVLGEFELSLVRAQAASRIDPKLLTPHVEMMASSIALGHEEEALRQAKLLPTFRERDQPPHMRGQTFAGVMRATALGRQLATGDFARFDDRLPFPWQSTTLGNAELAARRHDVAQARRLITEAQVSGPVFPDEVNRARYYANAAAGDWPAAAIDAQAFASPQDLRIGVDTSREALPLVAYALARAGDFAGAAAAIGPTPLDCVACLRARGKVDALQGKWASADAWFLRAIAAAPSIPFAYAERGEMLLMKGEPDAAIAQFTLANKRGPHYADALELWGEALMAKQRPKLALAKFEMAARYAPNWGRLHLKWGEALAKAGKTADAQARWRRAAGLHLTPPERAELQRLTHKPIT